MEDGLASPHLCVVFFRSEAEVWVMTTEAKCSLDTNYTPSVGYTSQYWLQSAE